MAWKTDEEVICGFSLLDSNEALQHLQGHWFLGEVGEETDANGRNSLSQRGYSLPMLLPKNLNSFSLHFLFFRFFFPPAVPSWNPLGPFSISCKSKCHVRLFG